MDNLCINLYNIIPYFCSGKNVEDAFLDTAKKIFKNIQDGKLDLNSAESGVQHKPIQPGRISFSGGDGQANKNKCSC